MGTSFLVFFFITNDRTDNSAKLEKETEEESLAASSSQARRTPERTQDL